jgi:hypothetical protein
MSWGSKTKATLGKTVPLWVVVVMMAVSVGVSAVAASAIVINSQVSAQERAVVVTAQNLNDVTFTALNLVPEPYTAVPQVSSPTAPVILTGNDQNVISTGPSGQGYVRGDVAVQLEFNFSANPEAVIGVTSQYLYDNPAPQVWQVTTYVELASGMAPTNFTLSVELGLSISLATVDITMTASAYVDPLPAIPLPSAPGPVGGSVVVVDPVAYVTNDVDSGFYSYWAIDNYTMSFEMWQEPNGTFYFVQTYLGTATTYAGVVSPGAEATEGGAIGSAYVAYFSGYISGWVTGTFSPSVPTSGFLGIYNFGGSESNLGTSTAHYSGTPAPDAVNWPNLYFSGTPTYSTTPFALAYFFGGQTWIDAGSVPQVSSGNILPPMSIFFQVSAGNSAGWSVYGADAYLTVHSSAPGSFAVLGVNYFNPTPPSSEPSLAATNYASGTPRIVIFMSDNNNLFIYPTGGPPTNYAAWLAAETADGATVTGVYIVADTSQPVPYTTDVTSFQYNGVFLIS